MAAGTEAEATSHLFDPCTDVTPRTGIEQAFDQASREAESESLSESLVPRLRSSDTAYRDRPGTDHEHLLDAAGGMHDTASRVFADQSVLGELLDDGFFLLAAGRLEALAMEPLPLQRTALASPIPEVHSWPNFSRSGGTSGGLVTAAAGNTADSAQVTAAPVQMSRESMFMMSSSESGESPPIANDDDDGTVHDQTINVPAPGVLANDEPTDGDPMTAELVTGPDVGDLTLNSDGSYTYTPPANWAGSTSFTYVAVDNDGASDPAATVTINVFNWAPMANDDGPYSTEASTLLEVPARGVLENDEDTDHDPLTLVAVLDTPPEHAASFTLNPDGSFSYMPESGFAGTDQFTYFANDQIENSDPATVTIQVVPRVDLIIHHGQGGAAVPAATEESVGAFTVANLNDTDGDGVEDSQDWNGVFDRDEVDLMKLVLKKPDPYIGGTATLTYSISQVALWNDSTKAASLPEGDTGSVEFDLSGGDRTVWVEIIQPSAQVRDIALTLTYQQGSDTVSATGIWSTLTGVEHDTQGAATLFAQPEWSDMTTPPKDRVQFFGGTGLRPIDAAIGVANVIVMRFTVTPAGIGNEDNVRFDVTRRVEWNSWWLNANGTIVHTTSGSFPASNEEPNDDEFEGDESTEPNANNHMFGYDPPGLNTNIPSEPTDEVYVSRLNFEEFVRVGLGSDPSGNSVSGSRASSTVFWHARHRLTNEDGVWVRSTGDDQETDENDIGLGHITIGSSP